MVTTTCVNHPKRAAIEACEVCSKPLCAYCLYYTDDGQRLCREHAERAHEAGARVHAPQVYAESLISAQVGADQPERKSKPIYEGDTVDVLALIGLIVAVVGLMVCFPPALCLIGPIGLILSLVALVGAKNARNPSRVRTMAGIGATISGLWVVIVAACILAYFAQITAFTTMIQTGGVPVPIQGGQFAVTVVVPIGPQPVANPTGTPTASP
jgi:hypothetical protein